MSHSFCSIRPHVIVTTALVAASHLLAIPVTAVCAEISADTPNDASQTLPDRGEDVEISIAPYTPDYSSPEFKDWISMPQDPLGIQEHNHPGTANLAWPVILRNFQETGYDVISLVTDNSFQWPDAQRTGEGGHIYFATLRNLPDHHDDGSRHRAADTRTNTVTISCGTIIYGPDSRSFDDATVDGPENTGFEECQAYFDHELSSSKRVFILQKGPYNRFPDAADQAIYLKNTLCRESDVLLLN